MTGRVNCLLTNVGLLVVTLRVCIQSLMLTRQRKGRHTIKNTYTASILDTVAKLRKASISLVMSVLPHGTNLLSLDGFS